MHIRLMALGSRGDVQPYVALGLGLQRAGYDVSIGTTADFRPLVEQWGLACVTTAHDMRQVVTKGRSRRAARWEFFRVLLDSTLDLAQGAEVLIYGPAAILSAPHVAEKLGIPGLPTLLQPFMTPTRAFPAVGMPALPLGGAYNAFSYKLFERFTWLFLKGSINRWRQETLGLPPYTESGPFALLRKPNTPTLYGFSPSVLPKPPDWGPNIHVTGYWFLPETTDWQPPPALVDFLRAGPPPVYVGFGSLIDDKPEQLATLVLNGVKQAGVRAILASGWGSLAASEVPKDVLLLESVPHDWLFPRLAAVVHHGGAGTTAAGLRAGVPNVVVPFRGDQPFWARRVAQLGAGPEALPRRRLTAERLAAALHTAVSDPAIKQVAAELGAAIRAEDGVGNAVRVIGAALPALV